MAKVDTGKANDRAAAILARLAKELCPCAAGSRSPCDNCFHEFMDDKKQPCSSACTTGCDGTGLRLPEFSKPCVPSEPAMAHSLGCLCHATRRVPVPVEVGAIRALVRMLELGHEVELDPDPDGSVACGVIANTGEEIGAVEGQDASEAILAAFETMKKVTT